MKRTTNTPPNTLSRRPLSLRREVVRVLSDAQLRLVPGGVGSDSVHTPAVNGSCKTD